MKIPKKLKIRRSTWSVGFSDKLEQTENAIGLCIRTTKRILISSNINRNDIEETFIHEILHACWPAGVCSDRLEERLVERISVVLHQVLSDNKMLNNGRSRSRSTKSNKRPDRASSRKRRT